VSTGNSFLQLFSNLALRAQLISALQTTIVSIFLGFGLAVVVGVPIGILMGRYLVADVFLEPWVNSWYSIPAVAFVPLTMNWTGITWISAMITAFLIAVFSIVINVYSGVKNCSRSLVESALAYRASQPHILFKVVLPNSMPNVVVGLRQGIARAIEGVIIAEMIFTVIGLGGMIDSSADKLQLALSYSLMIVLVIISLIFTELVKRISRKAVVWKESEAMIPD
jgi:ABC-type nitrate/sulfonate/bicarbonate transport system permease component